MKAVLESMAETWSAELRELIDPQQTALVVWDLQRGIAANAHNASLLRANIPKLLDAASAQDVLTIWTRHVSPAPRLASAPALRRLMQQQGVHTVAEVKPRMQAGTDDVLFIDGFAPAANDVIIEKSTPSLFVGTPVELILRNRGIHTLVICGVATEMGVEMSARHAFALGLFCVVVEDAVGSYTAGGHELGLAYLRTAAVVETTDAVARAWPHPVRG
jgi:nicotinamidase-related amidase